MFRMPLFHIATISKFLKLFLKWYDNSIPCYLNNVCLARCDVYAFNKILHTVALPYISIKQIFQFNVILRVYRERINILIDKVFHSKPDNQFNIFFRNCFVFTVIYLHTLNYYVGEERVCVRFVDDVIHIFQQNHHKKQFIG